MLGENIRRLREERNLTQKDIAEAVHASNKTVMSWESNKTEPKASELVLIAQTLGVSINELIGEEENEQTKLISKISSAVKQFSDDEIHSLSVVVEGMFLRNQSHKARCDFRI